MSTWKQFLDKKEFSSIIHGKEVIGINKVPIELISPVTKKAWKKVFPLGADDVGQAINSSQQAFSTWSQIPSPIRAQKLRKVADLLLENKKKLAEVMTLEMGKPITESCGEIEYSAGFFSWYAGEAERIYGKTIPSQYAHKSLKVIHEPVGVCGVITPWNFPIAMPSRKVAAALAAGCTVIAKPSPECPISMLLLQKICQMAEVPNGVFNVVIGDEEEIGGVLLDAYAVRKISFTGSTSVGKYLYRRSANTMKKLTMELGGHAPLLIFDDADLKTAVRETLLAKFRNTGQTCIAANRILVQEGIYKAFLDAFTQEVKKLKVGDPLKKETEISKVLHPSSEKRVPLQIQDALEKGAKGIILGNEPYEPTLLTGITPSMKIFSEETFGPVASLMKFTSFEEGITLANASEFGLAAYLFTENMKIVKKATSQLEYGIIGVNDGLPSTAQASFGGVKYSGLGREGGPTGIYEYLNEKYISITFSY